MNRIGIYGGAFDPPHVGHLQVISTLLNSGEVDQVWIAPSGERPDKSYHVSEEHRKNMLEELIQYEFGSDSRVKIDWRQFYDKENFSTYHLLAWYERDYPQDQFLFVMGADLITDLPNWDEPEWLQTHTVFLVIGRGGFSVSVLDKYQVRVITSPFLSTVSSSDIREILKYNGQLSGILPKIVTDYIEKNGLYRYNSRGHNLRF